MYERIEKEYKKADSNSDFDKYYWKWTIIIVIIFLILLYFFPNNIFLVYLMYTIIFIVSSFYFINDFKNTIKIKGKNIKFSKKLEQYRVYKRKEREIKLLFLLKKYGFNTKNNLKIAIDYYNRKRPISIDSSFLGWIVSISIALASLVEVAYDKDNEIIDYTKISVIFSSTLGIVLSITVSLLFFKFIFNKIRTSKIKLYSNIEEDLTIIYLKFDKYKNQLNKNLTNEIKN